MKKQASFFLLLFLATYTLMSEGQSAGEALKLLVAEDELQQLLGL